MSSKRPWKVWVVGEPHGVTLKSLLPDTVKYTSTTLTIDATENAKESGRSGKITNTKNTNTGKVKTLDPIGEQEQAVSVANVARSYAALDFGVVLDGDGYSNSCLCVDGTNSINTEIHSCVGTAIIRDRDCRHSPPDAILVMMSVDRDDSVDNVKDMILPEIRAFFPGCCVGILGIRNQGVSGVSVIDDSINPAENWAAVNSLPYGEFVSGVASTAFWDIIHQILGNSKASTPNFLSLGCTETVKTEPAVFKSDWAAFSNRVIRLGHESISLLCNNVTTITEGEMHHLYDAVGPSQMVEQSVFQILNSLGDGRSNVKTIRIRFDVSEDVCISIVIALVKYGLKVPNHPYKTIVADSGELSAMAFDAICKKMKMLNLEVFALSDFQTNAAPQSWALLGTSKLKGLRFDAVQCTESTIVGLVAFLKTDKNVTKLEVMNTNFDSEMLEAILNAIPEKPQAHSVSFTSCKLTTVPAQFARKFSNLVELSLANNRLDEISCCECLAELVTLEKLDVSKNRFTSFAPCLAELPLLRDLNISYNEIKIIKAAHFLAGFSQIVSCNYQHNPFLSTMPKFTHNNFTALRKYACDLSMGNKMIARSRLVFVGDSCSSRGELRASIFSSKKSTHFSASEHTIVCDAVERKPGKSDTKIDFVNYREFQNGLDDPLDNALFTLECINPPTDSVSRFLMRQNTVTTIFVAVIRIGETPLENAKSEIEKLMRSLRTIQASCHEKPKCMIVGLKADKCPNTTVALIVDQINAEIRRCAIDELPDIVDVKTLNISKSASTKALKSDLISILRSECKSIAVPTKHSASLTQLNALLEREGHSSFLTNVNQAMSLFARSGVQPEQTLALLSEIGFVYAKTYDRQEDFVQDVAICSTVDSNKVAQDLMAALERSGFSVSILESFEDIRRSRVFMVVGLNKVMTESTTKEMLVHALSLSRRHGFPRICVVKTDESDLRKSSELSLLRQKVVMCYQPFVVGDDDKGSLQEVVDYTKERILDSYEKPSASILCSNRGFVYQLISMIEQLDINDDGHIEYQKLLQGITSVHQEIGSLAGNAPIPRESLEMSIQLLRDLGYCCQGSLNESEILFSSQIAIDDDSLWHTNDISTTRDQMPWSCMPSSISTPGLVVLETEYVMTVLPHALMGILATALLHHFDIMSRSSAVLKLASSSCDVDLHFNRNRGHTTTEALKAALRIRVSGCHMISIVKHFQTVVKLIDKLLQTSFPNIVLYSTNPCPGCNGASVKLPWPRATLSNDKKVFSGCSRCVRQGRLVSQYQILEPYWVSPSPAMVGKAKLLVVHARSDRHFAEAVCRWLEEQQYPYELLRCGSKTAEDNLLAGCSALLALVSNAMLVAPACLRQLRIAYSHGVPVVSLDIDELPDNVKGAIGKEGHVTFDPFRANSELALQLVSDILTTNIEEEHKWVTDGFGPITMSDRKDVLVLAAPEDRQEVRILIAALERKGISGWLNIESTSFDTELKSTEQVSIASRLLVYNTESLSRSAFCAEQIAFAHKLHTPISCVFSDENNEVDMKNFDTTVASIIDETPSLAVRKTDASTVAQATKELVNRRGSLLTVSSTVEDLHNIELLSKIAEQDQSDDDDVDQHLDIVASQNNFDIETEFSIDFTNSPALQTANKEDPNHPYLLVAAEGTTDVFATPESTPKPHKVKDLIHTLAKTPNPQPDPLTPNTIKTNRRIDRKAQFREGLSVSRPRYLIKDQSVSEANSKGMYRPSALPNTLIPKLNYDVKNEGTDTNFKSRLEKRREIRSALISAPTPHKEALHDLPDKYMLDEHSTIAPAVEDEEAIKDVLNSKPQSSNMKTTLPNQSEDETNSIISEETSMILEVRVGFDPESNVTVAEKHSTCGVDLVASVVKHDEEPVSNINSVVMSSTSSKIDGVVEDESEVDAPVQKGGVPQESVNSSFENTERRSKMDRESILDDAFEFHSTNDDSVFTERDTPNPEMPASLPASPPTPTEIGGRSHSNAKPPVCRERKPSAAIITLSESLQSESKAESTDGPREVAKKPIVEQKTSTPGKVSAAGKVASAVWPPVQPVVQEMETETLPKRRPTKTMAPPSATFLALQRTASTHVGHDVRESAKLSSLLERVSNNDPTLEIFDISNYQAFKRLTKKEKEAKFFDIIELLQANTHLRELNFANIGANDFFAEELADFLMDNDTITTINLDTNEIYENGFNAIAAMIRRNTTLQKLKCANQAKPAPTKSLYKISDAVNSNETLTTCTIACRDPTAREKLNKALARNCEIARIKRVTAASSDLKKTILTKQPMKKSESNEFSSKASKKPPLSRRPSIPKNDPKIVVQSPKESETANTIIRKASVSELRNQLGHSIGVGSTSRAPVKQSIVLSDVTESETSTDPFEQPAPAPVLNLQANRHRRTLSMSSNTRRRLPTRRRPSQISAAIAESVENLSESNNGKSISERTPQLAVISPSILESRKKKDILSSKTDTNKATESQESIEGIKLETASSVEDNQNSPEKVKINGAEDKGQDLVARDDGVTGVNVSAIEVTAITSSQDPKEVARVENISGLSEVVGNQTDTPALFSNQRDLDECDANPVSVKVLSELPGSQNVKLVPKKGTSNSDVETGPSTENVIVTTMKDSDAKKIAPIEEPSAARTSERLKKAREERSTASTDESATPVRRSRAERKVASSDVSATPRRRERLAQLEEEARREQEAIEKYRLERKKKREALKASRS